MSRLTTFQTLVVVGLLSGTLGFWTRTRVQHGHAQQSTDAVPGPENRVASQKSRPDGVSLPPKIAQFRKDIAISTGVTRWLHWMEAIENADAADFAELSRMAESDPQLYQLVVARWSERYPKHMFET